MMQVATFVHTMPFSVHDLDDMEEEVVMPFECDGTGLFLFTQGGRIWDKTADGVECAHAEVLSGRGT